MTQPTITQDKATGARPPVEEPRGPNEACPPDIRNSLREWVGETVTIYQDDGRPIVGRLMEASPEHLVIQEYLQKNRYSPTEMKILKAMGADKDLVSYDPEYVLRVSPGDIYARLRRLTKPPATPPPLEPSPKAGPVPRCPAGVLGSAL